MRVKGGDVLRNPGIQGNWLMVGMGGGGRGDRPWRESREGGHGILTGGS